MKKLGFDEVSDFFFFGCQSYPYCQHQPAFTEAHYCAQENDDFIVRLMKSVLIVCPVVVSFQRDLVHKER